MERATAAPPAQHAPASDNTAAVFANAFGGPGMMASGNPTPAPANPGQPDAGPTVEPPLATTIPTPAASQPPVQTLPPGDPPTTQQELPEPPAFLPPGDPAAAAATPVTPLPQHTVVAQDQSLHPPTPPSPAPPNPFGTPRPPIVFAPVPAPAEKSLREDGAPTDPAPQETPAAAGTRDDAYRGVDVAAGGDANEAVLDESDAPMMEPDQEPGTTSGPPAGDDLPADAAHEERTGNPEISVPNEPDSPADTLEPPTDEDEDGDGDEAVEEESADVLVADFNDAEHTLPMEPAAEATAPHTSPDEPQPDDEFPDMAAPEEQRQFGDSLGEAASRMGMDLRQSQRQVLAETYEDFIGQERQRGLESPGTPADEAVAEPADEAGIETDYRANGTPKQPDKQRTIDRRDSGWLASADAVDDEDGESAEAVRDASSQEPRPPQPPGSTGGNEGELARAIREAEQGAARESDPLSHRPIPKSEEELTAAAKELGISFREDPEDGRPLAPYEQDDEMARVARELGISFRDDSVGPTSADPDDPAAKAARELGISFRDGYQPEKKQKSVMLRYWRIILVIALAAFAMPVLAAYLMFSGS
ncbi:MAG: hypothetical protein OEN55_02010 [Alphaproteobacteria bacterium]|nr:hypothetical protein [Alphaproteobacteria bacterium]